MGNEGERKVRIDKWLWAARFFKTRNMAAVAVSGGKVHVNGERIKPARIVQPGDILAIRRGEVEFEVTVLDVNDKRRPASEACLLYRESEESIRNREVSREQRRLLNAGNFAPAGRPSKRDRRLIKSFTRND